MLTDRRAELRSSLEKLEGNGENKNFIFEFSNDKEVASHIPDVVKQVEQLAAPTKIGLVVGSGGLLTWGALLPSIDLWIQLDKNPQLLAWMKSLSDDIVSTPLMQTFETNLFSKVKGKAYKPQAYIEKSSYGQWHYLSQQYSYDRTRSFLEQESVARVTGNLEDSSWMRRAGDALQAIDGSIVFANMTNVWDYRWVEDKTGARMEDSLSQLPFHPEASFLSSSNYRGLIAQHDNGFDRYRERALVLLTEEREKREKMQAVDPIYGSISY